MNAVIFAFDERALLKRPTAPTSLGAIILCAEHVRQLEGESPFDNLVEVKP